MPTFPTTFFFRLGAIVALAATGILLRGRPGHERFHRCGFRPGRAVRPGVQSAHRASSPSRSWSRGAGFTCPRASTSPTPTGAPEVPVVGRFQNFLVTATGRELKTLPRGRVRRLRHPGHRIHPGPSKGLDLRGTENPPELHAVPSRGHLGVHLLGLSHASDLCHAGRSDRVRGRGAGSADRHRSQRSQGLRSSYSGAESGAVLEFGRGRARSTRSSATSTAFPCR